MEAIKFLLNRYNTILNTFTKIQSKSSAITKKKMFDLSRKDLIRHKKMEQVIGYPYLKKHTSLKIKHILKEEKLLLNPSKNSKKINAFKSKHTNHFL